MVSTDAHVRTQTVWSKLNVIKILDWPSSFKPKIETPTNNSMSTEFFMLPEKRNENKRVAGKKSNQAQNSSHMFINQSYSLLFLWPTPRFCPFDPLSRPKYANIVVYFLFCRFFFDWIFNRGCDRQGFASDLFSKFGDGARATVRKNQLRCGMSVENWPNKGRLLNPPPLPGPPPLVILMLRRAFVSLSPHSNCANHQHTSICDLHSPYHSKSPSKKCWKALEYPNSSLFSVDKRRTMHS